MRARVTGFGLPAHTNLDARTRAGVRKPPGKEGAGCVAPDSAGAMGIWLARSQRPYRSPSTTSAADFHGQNVLPPGHQETTRTCSAPKLRRAVQGMSDH
jgi:hypothetical protein